jgi:hypothetical protein
VTAQGIVMFEGRFSFAPTIFRGLFGSGGDNFGRICYLRGVDASENSINFLHILTAISIARTKQREEAAITTFEL